MHEIVWLEPMPTTCDLFEGLKELGEGLHHYEKLLYAPWSSHVLYIIIISPHFQENSL